MLNTELFDLSKHFSLSGNQPYEKKAKLFDWKAKYDPDELLKKGLITKHERKNW